ncbi:TPR repeat-containing protein [Colletotrichum tofieldiae]|uniref:TPR repeat-containing protein n=1 Tax=Colletotrichum tofieldiae TaxID=708197 RepID=A0A166Y215_9PEZI|nr:TPR repeat-containing protein [Colletotrichum tofieldiae]GKT53975.1 TPR repeat-containing protein [Colletotrichum tofieldiae]GKT73710.1 TPR repeat-containing protein [Colletotrichum tofieldiae]GKT95664.1 TPR repeat-containing protein [Colletotrichum tofieldiae]
MRPIKATRWRAVSRNSDKASILTLLGISELLKLRGKWHTALRLGNFALQQSQGLGTLTEGLALLSVGHAYRNQTPEDWISAQHHLRMAKLLLEGLPPSEDQTFYLMRAVLLLGDTLVRREDLGDIAEAEELAHLAERLLRQSRERPGKSFRWTLFTGSWRDFCVHSMVELGEIYYYTSRWAEGEKLLRELVPTLVKRRGKRHVTTIEAQRDLASMLVNQDKYEEAEIAYRVARDWNEEVPVFGHEEKAAIDYNIAMCLSERGKDQEARAEIGNMDLAADLLHYANGEWTLKLARLTSLRLKKYEEVVALCQRFQRVLDEHRARFGPCSPVTLRNMEDHVTALKALRRWDEAIVILRDMCRREASDVARVVEQTLETRLNLAHTLRHAGLHEEAAYEYRKCLEIERAASDDFKDEAQIRNILKYLAYLYELARDKTNALIAYSQLQREYWGRPSQHRNFIRYEWCRGKMFMLQGRWEHALKLLMSALAVKRGIETAVSIITGLPIEAVHAMQPGSRAPDPARPEMLEVDSQTAKDDEKAVDKTSIRGHIQVTELDLEDEEDRSWDEVDWWEEVIKDAVDAVRREESFQSCTPLDEADSEVDDEEGDETVDAVLTMKSGYPAVPADDEWSQPQWPRLPDTYEELVIQQRSVVEESRPWIP